VVKPATKEEVTKSGIVLPTTSDKERPDQGEVVAIGPGRILDNGQRQELAVKIGDKILFKKYSPEEFEINGEKMLLIREEDIMAVIK
jgi:chaperonin GroES